MPRRSRRERAPSAHRLDARPRRVCTGRPRAGLPSARAGDQASRPTSTARREARWPRPQARSTARIPPPRRRVAAAEEAAVAHISNGCWALRGSSCIQRGCIAAGCSTTCTAARATSAAAARSSSSRLRTSMDRTLKPAVRRHQRPMPSSSLARRELPVLWVSPHPVAAIWPQLQITEVNNCGAF